MEVGLFRAVGVVLEPESILGLVEEALRLRIHS
jgi:hypothetical protein